MGELGSIDAGEADVQGLLVEVFALGGDAAEVGEGRGEGPEKESAAWGVVDTEIIGVADGGDGAEEGTVSKVGGGEVGDIGDTTEAGGVEAGGRQEDGGQDEGRDENAGVREVAEREGLEGGEVGLAGTGGVVVAGLVGRVSW